MASAVLVLSMFIPLPSNKDSEITMHPLSNLDGVMNYGYTIHSEAHQSLILNSSDEILQPA